VSPNVTGDSVHAQPGTITAAFDIPNPYGSRATFTRCSHALDLHPLQVLLAAVVGTSTDDVRIRQGATSLLAFPWIAPRAAPASAPSYRHVALRWSTVLRPAPSTCGEHAARRSSRYVVRRVRLE
jgi:hypothetical protein